jgi:hypothetical protein
MRASPDVNPAYALAPASSTIAPESVAGLMKHDWGEWGIRRFCGSLVASPRGGNYRQGSCAAGRNPRSSAFSWFMETPGFTFP